MRLKHLTPMLWTNDVPATIEFYRSVLDFELITYSEEWQWCSMKKDDVDIMFAKPTDHTPIYKPIFTGSFYFYTDEVDELWEKLKESSLIYYNIWNFPHRMREFAIKDNNGYILQFGKEITEDEVWPYTAEENQ